MTTRFTYDTNITVCAVLLEVKIDHCALITEAVRKSVSTVASMLRSVGIADFDESKLHLHKWEANGKCGDKSYVMHFEYKLITRGTK